MSQKVDVPVNLSTLKGKRILLTGATGFLGKVLVAKILRDVDVAQLFILVRGDPKKRIEEDIKGAQCFEKGNFPFEKMCGISGDVTLPNLGMNEVGSQSKTK